MKVLALCSYPEESASTRFRISQYVEPLKASGVDVEVWPFLNSRQFAEFYSTAGIPKKVFGLFRPVFERLVGLIGAKKYDLIFVQREAMIFGPAIFERLYRARAKAPLILDLDDATYVSYVSPSYGRLGSFFKSFAKADRLIELADLVVCGNRFIAAYVEAKGTRAIVVPTVVDNNIFTPIEKANDVPVLGWIGTHSTFSFLESLFPVLERLAETHRFKLCIVGAGKKGIIVPGVDVEELDWKLERETSDFQSFDIGLYPITPSSSANEQWILGKSGFKAIQYMAVGVPFVMSPVGVCAEIGEVNVTHFNAVTPEDWYNSLSRLIADKGLRTEMGTRGRRFSLDHFSVSVQAAALVGAMKDLCGAGRKTSNLYGRKA